MQTRWIAIGLSLAFSGCVSQPIPLSAGNWLDLTHEFSSRTVYWPNAEHFKLETVFDGTTAKGYHYSANRYMAAEHGGTHMDAPIHFDAKGRTIERIPVDQTIGPAVVVDVTTKANANRDYQIGVEDFLAWEKSHGRIPEHSIVLLRTSYDRYWPNALKYLGTEERGEAAIPKLHFPGLAPEGARWLSEQRKIKAVGLDTASIDYGQSTLFESHQILSRSNIPILENLEGLGQLPPVGATLVAFPMKIEGGSGAPLRATAWLPDR